MNERVEEPAKRFDKGKLRWDLLDWRCVKEVVKVYTFGAKKYADHNWRKGMSYSRVWSSLERHLYSFWVDGELYDKESGIHHLAHAAWNCFTLMWYSWFMVGVLSPTGEKLDDRPGPTWTISPMMGAEDENGMPVLDDRPGDLVDRP